MTEKTTGYAEAAAISDVIRQAAHIVVIQADNPDADSMASALALEHILGDMGKQVSLYCSVDMPGYLRYVEGWDRVQAELPRQFDASIIVDASTMVLLEKLQQTGQINWLATRPCLVLDHHQSVGQIIPFATSNLTDEHASSTGELIYNLGKQLGWTLSVPALTHIVTAVLGDTQGLSNQLTSANTYRLMAEATEAGVDRPRLEEARRAYSKMPAIIYKYKGRLIERTELVADGRLALVMVPQTEISDYSPLYNPGPLIQADMLQTQRVATAIVFKCYNDGKITAAIRCNHAAPIAAALAEHFGGGGHAYASGFKITNGRPFNEIKSECIRFATHLLDQPAAEAAAAQTAKEARHETVQHSQQAR